MTCSGVEHFGEDIYKRNQSDYCRFERVTGKKSKIDNIWKHSHWMHLDGGCVVGEGFRPVSLSFQFSFYKLHFFVTQNIFHNFVQWGPSYISTILNIYSC